MIYAKKHFLKNLLIKEVSHPYLLNNFFKMVAENKNSSKIELHYDMLHIPKSLNAKFQGNQTIRLGEKTRTTTQTHRQTVTRTDTLEFYKDTV